MTQTQALPPALTATLQDLGYLSVTETALLVRKSLKEAFPEVKFSVRSSRYAGGASIDVRWTDGPTAALVDPIIKQFAGAGFDGMCDLQYANIQTMGGRRVRFGADYVHSQREIAKDRIDALEAEIAKVDREMWLTVLVEAGHSAPCVALSYAHSVRDVASAILSDVCDAKWQGRRSPTAESVEYLGNTHDDPPV